jgi:hypothetical protein
VYEEKIRFAVTNTLTNFMLIFLLAVGYFAVLLTIGFDDDFYKW